MLKNVSDHRIETLSYQTSRGARGGPTPWVQRLLTFAERPAHLDERQLDPGREFQNPICNTQFTEGKGKPLKSLVRTFSEQCPNWFSSLAI